MLTTWQQIHYLFFQLNFNNGDEQMRQVQETVNYLDINQARDLVDRIATRCKDFNHTMTENEKEAMAQLLSDIGVMTSDLIDVSRLADNYAINAEIVTPSDYDSYDMHSVREDSLFQWEEEDGTYYCLSW